MSTDDTEPTPPDDAAGEPQEQHVDDTEAAQPPSSPETDSEPTAEPQAEQPSEPVAADETPAPEAEQPSEPVAADETPAPEAEQPSEPVAADETKAPDAGEAEASDEGPRADSGAGDEAAASAPAPSGEASAAASPTAQPEDDEEFEPTPRAKPEIPGADLEPVFIPQEEQYLDAEAQAAAEAEAEAAAERARAEAEEEQARPIADAAIDLAAGARYTATGKRKTSVARVILRPGGGQYLINDRPLETMFPRETLQRMIRQPLETVGYEARMDVIARMHGGGVSSQAGALRHGIARALIVADPNLRGELKRRGYLTRDPRVKERKKAGLKKARKRPQFSKR